MRFRKKPVEIEAVQVRASDYNPALWGTPNNPFDGSPFSEQAYWLAEAMVRGKVRPVTPGHTDYAEWEIDTLEGTMLASPGDWIIRGVKGEIYPCKPDIFAMTYEPITDTASR